MTLTQELDKIYYFMKRDIISFSTYKTNILLSVVSALFGAFSYAFWGANASMPSVKNLGMPVVTYLLIGLAFNTYLSQSLTLVQRTINPWSLEEVLVSPTGLVTFIVGQFALGLHLEHSCHRHLFVGWSFSLRRHPQHQHHRNHHSRGIGHRNIHRFQHDRSRCPDFNQARRPRNHNHYLSHQPIWKRALPNLCHAASPTDNLASLCRNITSSLAFDPCSLGRLLG